MEQFTGLNLPMTEWQLSLVVFIGISGLILIVWGFSNLRHGRWLRACMCSSSGGLFLCFGGLFLLVFSNLYTYQRLSYERPIAELQLKQTGEKQFQAKLRFSQTDQTRVYDLKGDEWQIDARILKWKYPVIWLGLDSHYQLERISGRYRDIQEEQLAERTVHSLQAHPEIDLWHMIRDYQDKMPWVDALYGSATYLPMHDGARFEISISQTGLITRALNEPAKASVSGWY